LQQICNYVPAPVPGDEEDEPSLLPAIPFSYKKSTTDEPVTLHEILMSEKLDLEAKVKRTSRRRRWLKGVLEESQKILRSYFRFELVR